MNRNRRLFKRIERQLDRIAALGVLGREQCERLMAAKRDFGRGFVQSDEVAIAKAIERMLGVLVDLESLADRSADSEEDREQIEGDRGSEC